jgi:hypothetical protein
MDWPTEREALVSKMAKLENRSLGEEETNIYINRLKNSGNSDTAYHVTWRSVSRI